jgi:N-acetylglutamate synthase-like GNAT family acetyltransferase
MSELATIPKIDLTIRPATVEDVPFIDSLQKIHRKAVGFMPQGQLVGKINAGDVIIAEDAGGPVGYCIGTDRYFKHDDVGIIYQLNVIPGKQRGFVGATLLKAMFERAAYGCKLFCCYCAQDLEANRFWESMGFVPLAFRAGSEKKSRIHIFWQKRIRAGDSTTPWWFPAKTDAGALRADRLVFPIPPGKHWSDEMPVIVPQATDEKRLPGEKKPKKPVAKAPPMHRAAKQFGPVTMKVVEPEPVAIEKPKQGGREKKPKVKADPKLVSAARELRDRWLEHVNSGGALIESQGKYDVTRMISVVSSPKLLTAA